MLKLTENWFIAYTDVVNPSSSAVSQRSTNHGFEPVNGIVLAVALVESE